MPFQVSPGVNTSEIDLTTIVPGISSIDAGFAGAFRWGPVNDVTLIDSEDLLKERFQAPDANTYTSFLLLSAMSLNKSLHLGDWLLHNPRQDNNTIRYFFISNSLISIQI